jgi:hypothetical protein
LECDEEKSCVRKKKGVKGLGARVDLVHCRLRGRKGASVSGDCR